MARSGLASATLVPTRSSRALVSARSALVASEWGAGAPKRCASVRASSHSTQALKRSDFPWERKRGVAALTWFGCKANTVSPASSSRSTNSPSLDHETVDGEPDQQLAERANPLLVGAKTARRGPQEVSSRQRLTVATTRLVADREPLWPAEPLLRAFAALAGEFSRCRTSTAPPDAGAGMATTIEPCGCRP